MKVKCPESGCGKKVTLRSLPTHLKNEHACTPHQVGRMIEKLEQDLDKQAVQP